MIALKAATDGCAARSFTARPAVAPYRSFTIVELLVVIAVIIVLAALILSISGYVQRKGARSRAEAEIAAMSAALESYRADNGIYPSSAANNSHALYQAITGDGTDALG
ncbi:MAG: type II secretion system protein, partial [Chthoniobacterales bacterium]